MDARTQSNESYVRKFPSSDFRIFCCRSNIIGSYFSYGAGSYHFQFSTFSSSSVVLFVSDVHFPVHATSFRSIVLHVLVNTHMFQIGLILALILSSPPPPFPTPFKPSRDFKVFHILFCRRCYLRRVTRT